jgi:hypothetical protein
MNALVQLINTVSRYLKGAGIPHVIVGGVAVAIWGRPRATEDVDIVVDLADGQIEAFAAHLDAHGIRLDAKAARRALADGKSFSLADQWSIHWVDVRPPVRPIDHATIERATHIELAGEQVAVATAEDTVIGKLLAGRLQDLLDAKSVVLRRGDKLDRAYLQNRAREMGIESRLREVLPAA